ncbi:BTB/POZ and MATH domain-containing protein 1-like [Carex rostrata]
MASCEGNNNFTTSSVCVNRLVSGTHHCKIVGYSAFKAAFIKHIQSSSFRIGGLEWAIRCRAFAVNSQDFAPYMSLFLVLLRNPAEAVTYAVRYELSLLDKEGRPSPKIIKHDLFNCFGKRGTGQSGVVVGIESGFKFFITHSQLETQYIRNDCFTVHCSISQVLESTKMPVPAPVLNLRHHLGNLLESGVGADVNFQVKGEIFRAHRCMLAARSPVFHAQFFGPMSVKSYDIEPIKIDDVEPMVFKGFLNFIYTDSVPEIYTGADGEAMEKSDSVKLTQHLLVAADRFLVDDLYNFAEERLCERISVDTVETTFALAEQYNLHRLKAACIKSGVMPINLYSKILI